MSILRLVSKKCLFSLGLMTITLVPWLAASAAVDVCVRHIYNNSHSNWTFAIRSSSGDLGSSVMSGDNCPPDSTTCTSVPGGVISIIYYPAAIPLAGTMYITDKTGDERNFDFMPDPAHCEYIDHGGDTGAVAVNDETYGDFTVYGDTWTSSKKK